MTPYLPEESIEWQQICTEFIISTAKLQESIHPNLRKALAPLLEMMNCYYSNLIEGHRTYPVEIARAINKTSESKDEKALVLEALAHIHTQREITQKMANDDFEPSDEKWIRWMHSCFVGQLPEELRIVKSAHAEKTLIIKPGDLRDGPVIVGNHVAPEHTSLNTLLTCFREQYGGISDSSPHSLARLAAAHHRFTWIHPFYDGNGRVARLITDSMLDRAGAGCQGLWRIARGFARTVEEYKRLLASADSNRQGALDGHGNLSQQALNMWCFYVIQTALDQVKFMYSLINPAELSERIKRWAAQSFKKTNQDRIGLLLAMITRNGFIDRKTATLILGVTGRQSRNIIEDLAYRGLIVSAPREDLKPVVSIRMAPHWFPGLFPAEEEEWMRRAENV